MESTVSQHKHKTEKPTQKYSLRTSKQMNYTSERNQFINSGHNNKLRQNRRHQLYDEYNDVFAISYSKSFDRKNIRHGHYRKQTTT
jgi:hypothetical protein